MRKTVVLVGGHFRDDLYKMFSECCSKLTEKDISIKCGCMGGLHIETEQCIIHFLSTAQEGVFLRGVCGDICFYIPDALRTYIRCPRDDSTYSGSFIDYICEIEGIKE